MMCLQDAPWIQLSVSASSGWPHNALRHHWLMPISCHFRDGKALLVTSLAHVSGAIARLQMYLYVFTDVMHRLRCVGGMFTHARQRSDRKADTRGQDPSCTSTRHHWNTAIRGYWHHLKDPDVVHVNSSSRCDREHASALTYVTSQLLLNVTY